MKARSVGAAFIAGLSLLTLMQGVALATSLTPPIRTPGMRPGEPPQPPMPPGPIKRPEPPSPSKVPDSRDFPGSRGEDTGASSCVHPVNQPNITFTLTVPSDGIYPGDSATLRWDVRYRDGRRWDQEIHLRTDPPDLRRSLSLAPELLRENPGSYAITGSRRAPATIRLETRCGSQEVRYAPVPAPHLDTLTPARVGAGETVHLHGRDFGGSGEVQLVIGETRVTMLVHRWNDTDIEVEVPGRAAVGNGYIHLFKGRGRLQSNSREFRVVKVLAINRGFLRLVHELLNLSGIQIHLDHRGSVVRFPTELRSRGATDRSFSVPSVEVESSTLGDALQGILVPGGSRVDKVKYFVNDINLNSIALSVSGGQLVVSIGFESGGSEMKGEALLCILPPLDPVTGLILGTLDACATRDWDDGLAPDVNVNNATVTVRLSPVASDGALQLSSISGAFNADFQINNRIGQKVFEDMGYETRVRSAINDGLNNALDGFRDAISTGVMEQLRRPPYSVNRVLAVTTSAPGDSIRVEYE